MSKAALIYFEDDVELERIKAWIEKLKKDGHVKHYVAKEYEGNYGNPVWYIP